MAGFCWNSRQWLDFLFMNPPSCPYEKNGSECDKCGYFEEQKSTRYYEQKLKKLQLHQ